MCYFSRIEFTWYIYIFLKYVVEQLDAMSYRIIKPNLYFFLSFGDGNSLRSNQNDVINWNSNDVSGKLNLTCKFLWLFGLLRFPYLSGKVYICKFHGKCLHCFVAISNKLRVVLQLKMCRFYGAQLSTSSSR